MASRADPARIHEARQAATRNRLIGTGMDESNADDWLAAWAEQAAHEGIERGAAYWDAAWTWIAEQRKRRRHPDG